MRVTLSEGLKLMAKRAEKTLAQVSREMGVKPNSLSNLLSRGKMQTPVAMKMADVCGYKLVLVPENTEIKDGIEIALDAGGSPDEKDTMAS